MTNSRRKGADGEREIANKLKECGYNTRRGCQYSGANGDADVVGLPGIHMEVKRVEKLNIDNAMEQAVKDCHGLKMPTVFHRKDRKDWLVTMRLEDWIELYESMDGLRHLMDNMDTDYVCSYMMGRDDWMCAQEKDEWGECHANPALCYMAYRKRKEEEHESI